MSEFMFSPGLPPGYEFGYDQITSPVNVGSTTESSGTTIISCAAHWFDGGIVLAHFWCPYVNEDLNAAGDKVFVSLFEGATQLARILTATTLSTTSYGEFSQSGAYRFTPTAGLHTYTVTAHASSTSGTPSIGAGAAGTGAHAPAFIRFTKV